MGKPSTTQVSHNSSTHSIQSAKSTMSNKNSKITKKARKRKHYLKTQQSINKLFKQLRETSQSQLCSQNSSQSSIIDLDDSNITMLPGDLETINEFSRVSGQEKCIVIPDDDQKPCSSKDISFHASTPKRSNSKLYDLSKKLSLHTSTPKHSGANQEDVILSSSNNNLESSENRNMFQTIDLTGFNNSSKEEPTVIDLVDTNDEVTLVSVSNASSMSGDSEVTILKQPVSRKLKKLNNGIQNLNAAEKGKLLELITQTIFNGCNLPDNMQTIPNVQKTLPRAPDTAEDTYIKEVILGGKASRSSIGSNVYHPDRKKHKRTGKRMVVIDGSNVAMEHGRGKVFSVRGLQICINYFLRRGHVVKAFVPRFRCKYGMSTDPRLLDFLERQGLVVYTPSRSVQGRTITPYDDRYIIQCAAEFDAVIVSGDFYRDLANENPRWRVVIETRLLPFTWVDDMIMFPRDPLGRNGPSLEQFLSH